MKKYKISYYYYATGMEHGADTHPELTIEAETVVMAAYIYNILTNENYHTITFKEFLNKEDYQKYWGLTISENSKDEVA